MMEAEQIDRLIAEKVMGWRVHHRNTAHWVPGDYETRSDYRVMGWTSGTDRFSPSYRIADAWLVVEKMEADGWGWDLGSHGGLGNQTDRTCLFVKLRDPDETRFIEGHPTMPMAICLAALKAHGITPERPTP